MINISLSCTIYTCIYYDRILFYTLSYFFKVYKYLSDKFKLQNIIARPIKLINC